MDSFVIIRLARQIVALTESEVLQMLKANPLIWLEGIKRGKGINRYEKAQARKPKGAVHE
ncbi:hypothetical protein [Sporomusa sphaeroides]|uniref:Uncharacterized protein n=1 Tax=Sporomusa sphaeroides DSM 2875 TaxID=1337886 RepID=A0ABM9VXJ9_9FIRM|nr:hypothetical protein [Sporomusa sphaeroides]OLS58267.1 hypothetical protein SPSPH_18030 [Sporomusa sphaeroides DSM 2875]CVK17546.1 hypothetical protein SSPH_00180 [Sporomusa sphaeroides DSM 2875]